MKIKCLVSCRDSNGQPTFYPCRLRVSAAAYANGDHYDQAAVEATEAGYDDVAVVYDEKDGPSALFAHYFPGEPTGDAANDLSHAQLARIVGAVRNALWGDDGELDPDKEWDAETIDEVAGVLRDAGLGPADPE